MAATISVPYTIMWDSGITEGNPSDGPWARVRFKCESQYRYQLISDLMGFPARSGDTVIRTYPFAYPPSPNIICREIEDISFTGMPYPVFSDQWTVWLARRYAIVTALFRAANFFDGTGDPSGQPYTTTTLNISSEILTVPDEVYTFPSGWPCTGAGIPIVHIQIAMKRWQMPYLPISVIAAAAGKVNSNTITIGDLVAPEGTVLFTGAPVEITYDPQGNLSYSIEYLLAYREIPWTQQLSPKPGEGFAIPTDSSGNPMIGSYDFSTLP